LDYASIQEIIQGGLHAFIDAFQTKLNIVGEPAGARQSNA
jgi:hypothetical protein